MRPPICPICGAALTTDGRCTNTTHRQPAPSRFTATVVTLAATVGVCWIGLLALPAGHDLRLPVGLVLLGATVWLVVLALRPMADRPDLSDWQAPLYDDEFPLSNVREVRDTLPGPDRGAA